MPKVNVIMPICGSYCLEVEVDNVKDWDAIENAFYEKFETDGFDSSAIQWEFHRTIVQGNVFEGEQNEMEIEVIDEETECP